MDCREHLETYLRENGVEFEVEEHPIAYTAQRVAATEHVPGRRFAKVVMATAGDGSVMIVLPASSVLDLEKASTVTGSTMRLAHESEFAPLFPDCEPGAMPPFGNLYGVPVYVDLALGTNERIVFQAGSHGLTMVVPYADFERLAKPVVADLAVAA